MPFVPIPDTVQVDFIGELGGKEVIWGWQWQRDGGWSVGGADTLAADMFAWWDERILLNTAPQYLLNTIRVTDLSSSVGFVYDWTDALPQAGGAASPSSAANVAAVVSFKTGNRGRAYRGRCYLPGVPEGFLDVNTLSDAYRGNLLAAFVASTSIGSVLGADQVVASRTTNPGFVTQVTNWVVRPTSKRMGRRLPKS